jgi:Uncharacterised protein family (UPF0259)
MSFLASQPESIAKILDTSIKLYKASFMKLLGFFMVMAVFYVSLSFMIEPLMPTPKTDPTALPNFENFGMVFSFIVLISLLSFILYGAMIYRIDNVENQREDTLMEGLQVGFKTFPSVLLAVILYTIAMIVGMILLVIPGIILGLSLAFYMYFIVLDSLSGYASLKASHNLVWGHWWRTLTVFMAPGIVMMLIFVGIGVVAGVVAGGNSTLINIVTNLLSAFITPYFFTLGYVQFHDLKLRKSGSDLEKRLAR